MMHMLLPRQAAVSKIVEILARFCFLTETIRTSEFETHSCSPTGGTHCFNCSKCSPNDGSCSLRDNNLDRLDVRLLFFSHLPMHGCTLFTYSATLCPCNMPTNMNSKLPKELQQPISLSLAGLRSPDIGLDIYTRHKLGTSAVLLPEAI